MNEKQEAPTHLLGESSRERGQTQTIDGSRGRRGLLLLFARLLRPALTTALALPILWGLALAHWHGAPLNGWSIALLLTATGAFCIGLSLAGHYADFQRWLAQERSTPGGEQLLPEERQISSGQDVFQLLYSRQVRPGAVRSLVLLSLWITLLASLWLGELVGWPLFFFGLLSVLLAVLSLLPGVRYSRWLWIVGDLAVLAAVGFLPVLSAYYAHREVIDRWVLLAAVAPSLLAWLTWTSYNLLSWRRDWRIRRGTAVAIFGPERALDAGAVIGVAAFTSVLLLMALGGLPLSSLLVLGSLPIFLRAFTHTNQQPLTPTTAA
ncbi:MAG TPA: UbiA family prenyltransferase, partial [Caldilineaceae bacterium]|nr:UbiA family prenyltransferase [Caldilineaceae bacterium]